MCHSSCHSSRSTLRWLVAVVLAVGLGLALLACGGGQEGDPDSGPLPGNDGWEPLASVPGGPLQELAVVELDGTLYVAGGFRTRSIVADVLAYDIAAGQWRDVATLPAAVHHANLAAAGGKLYVLGSLAGLGFDALAASWQLDPTGGEWTPVASMDPLRARGAAAVGVIAGKIYLAGGFRDNAAVASFSSYNPATDTWDDTLPDLPAPRDHLVGAAVDGVFYVIGGRAAAIDSVSRGVLAFDPAQPAAGWVARASMPTARGGMAAGVVDGKIVVVGGEGNGAVSSGVFPQVESYDPVGDEWTALPSMRTPRHGMGAAGYQGKLYVPGGATRQGFGAVATFEALTPPAAE